MKFFYKIALSYQRARFRLMTLVSPQKAAREAFTLFCTPHRRKRSRPEAIIAEAAPLSLVMDGLNIYGYHWNHPASKKVLIVSKGEVPPEYLSIRRAVQNIKAGILWLHDEQDDTTPYRDAEQVKNDHHPHIQFIISSGLGH